MNLVHHTTKGALVAGILATALVGAGSGAAHASGGHDSTEVRASGSCSGTTDWKLKAKQDDGRLEVELEVDANRVGQTWQVTMSDNGTPFFSGSRVTAAPSGSFEVRATTANRAGTDRVTAVATNTRTHERCSAALSYPA
jgi:hypothetical protein